MHFTEQCKMLWFRQNVMIFSCITFVFGQTLKILYRSYPRLSPNFRRSKNPIEFPPSPEGGLGAAEEGGGGLREESEGRVGAAAGAAEARVRGHSQASVQQSRLSSQFAFQCCNFPKLSEEFTISSQFAFQSSILRCSKCISNGE